MSGRRYFVWVAVFAVIGAMVSGLALWEHYNREVSSFCSFNATFDCDVVNRSAYATVAGIPVALAGVLGYLGMLFLSKFQSKKPETPALLLLLSATGFAFSVYLTYVEGAILRTWCILCLTSLVAISVIALLSALRVRADVRRR